MRGKLAEIKHAGALVLVVDPHEPWAARQLLRESGLETDDVHLPLLMDPALTVSGTYGVAFQMRVHVEISNRPATFIIDRSGILRYARWAETFGDRPSPAEIIRELGRL